MDTSFLSLHYWKSIQDTARVTIARQLVEHLPQGFVFQSLSVCTLGTQRHPAAFFDWNPDRGLPGKFALIPGGEVTLSYNREHPFSPTTAQIESWQETQEEYGAADLSDFLNDTLTPRRVVTLRPFLMETTLLDTESGVSLDKNLWESRSLGFRLPTSDEWEWACGAGAQSLWRWGDDCPMDGYPFDYRRASAAWNLHRQPNAFGLHIADDDYHQEICEGNVLRGGNGGVNTCGGVGFLAAWLTLTSAYVLQEQEILEDLEEYNQGRRVFPL